MAASPTEQRGGVAGMVSIVDMAASRHRQKRVWNRRGGRVLQPFF
jgi:hypothetical protein